MHKTFIRVALTTPFAALLTGCTGDVLNVTNLNNPDVARAYSTPAGVESLIGSLGQQLQSAIQGSSEGLHTQSHVLSLEGYSSVANFGMQTRVLIPRTPILNDRGNQVATGNARDFQQLGKLTRTAANLVQAMDRITGANQTTGSAATDARDKAFALLVNGVALGYLAFGYDSGAIVTPAVPTTTIPALSGYAAVNKAAVALLDSAYAYASNPANATGFPLNSTWMNGNALTQDQFVRLIRSYRARIRAGVARTPAERAAVDWNSVIADATAGIQADFMITIGGGWPCSYDCSQMYVTGGWHQISPFYYGMADTSGAYETWLATALNSRDGFLIRTPDLRFPQGATRTAQQQDTPVTAALPNGRYLANRPTGDDTPGDPWGNSNYDYRRWLGVRLANVTGPYAAMSKTEIDMLAAEGYIRAGNFAAAQALIDASRARHGLASIGTITSASQQIQGGVNGCVPQVPTPPAFTSAACGTIMEAMKWEKRMETAYTGYMQWYADSRGWGDLVQNTALNWPVPYQEMDSRLEPFYNLGGGLAMSAGKGTYGF